MLQNMCINMVKCDRLSACWFMFYLILLALTKDSADAQEIRKSIFIELLKIHIL